MKSPDDMALIDTSSDAELVAASLQGDREAFGVIVERYQRLLCSLAYSATGSLTESEDVAQDAFVEAWRKLANLRDPEKLRPWLCTILRHKVGRLRRRDHREPVRGAEFIEEVNEISTDEAGAPETAMKEEEQAILWHALGALPDRYREPLVLYYREHRSIEHVAVELDLSEDAVKQRLSRGRKMLKEQALAFVEGALSRSTPGKLFTMGVLAALPAFSPPAKAAGIGAAAAAVGKGAGGIAKTTLLAAILASVSGLISSVMALRMNLDQSRTKRERRAVVFSVIGLVGSFMAFMAILFGARQFTIARPELITPMVYAVQALVMVFGIGWCVYFMREMRKSRALRSAERLRHPEKFADERDQIGSKASEYRSARTLFGVPLVHIRFGREETGQKPVFGWIAGGDRAIGLMFAWGGLAIAPFSVGAISIGIFTLGSVGVGVIGAGAVCFGWWAWGAVSVGMHAFGSLSATAWETAQGGAFALSNYVAQAPLAVAPHANDVLAWLTLYDPNVGRFWLTYFIAVIVLTLVPMSAYAKAVKHRMGNKPKRSSR